MYSCEDLSPNEHDGLQALTYRRNRRTGAVAVNGTPLAVLDALAEMGFLRRSEEGWVLMLQPCGGHPHLPGDLHASAYGIIPAEPVKTTRARSLEGQPPNTRGSIISIKGLVESFADQCRLHCWSSALTQQGCAALGAAMKRWVNDGATYEEIDWMVDQFFKDIAGQKQRQRGGHLWKMFIARKTTLHMAWERQHVYEDVEAHRYDPERWTR